MFGLGWGEMVVVGVVALIVVGPKDLPVMFRTMGRFLGKAKGMAREFTSAMNDAADGAGVRDIARDLSDATDTRKMGLDKIQEAATKFESWEPKIKADEGSETAKLSAERAEKAKKIHDYSAKKAAERKADEARKALADAEAELARSQKIVETPTAKAPAKKKPAAKKPAAKKTAAKKTATNKTTAKKASPKAAKAKDAKA